ncbi:hypothetical protein WJN01_09295 [Flavobacteriaceae bacterium SZ-1-7]|uniref:hypothetical protein n=1 Tax=Tamlana sedimenti TaxID=3134126 RepID=UPI0031261FD2
MKKFIFKTIFYIVLVLIALEGLVRVLHLYNDVPLDLYIDEYGIQKTVPGQAGFSVTGNRRMNFCEFHINKSGYNSYREFVPTKDKIEIALIGDSFIEGFNQHYYDSTGKKIENNLDNEVEVYEYGRGGYDMADQLYILNSYKETFDLIDHVFIYMKFENDFKRREIKPDHDLVNLKYTFKFQIKRYIKLLKYSNAIGLFDVVKNMIYRNKPKGHQKVEKEKVDENALAMEYIDNFKAVVNRYGFNKEKNTFLLDKRKTSPLFIDYCDKMGYKYLDFGPAFEKETKPTILIYDRHWNNRGRRIIAKVISDYVKKIDNRL